MHSRSVCDGVDGATSLDPFGERHAPFLPDRRFACQALFAYEVMADAKGCGEDKRMTKERSAPAPEQTLRMWRNHKKLTLEYVSSTIGVGPQALHKWEAGKVPITLASLRLLAEAYNATPAQLLSPPEDASAVAQLERAAKVLANAPAAKGERWLAMGEDLLDETPKEKK